MSTHDYSDFKSTPSTIGDNLMAQLTSTASDQAHAEARVARLEEELAEAKEHLRQLSENIMPELMEQAGMEEFSTKDGLSIKISEKIRGSIPKGNEAPAFRWLDENGHGNLIKRQFMIDFGKDQEKLVRKFEADLKRRKTPLNVSTKMSVHPSTLQSFIKDQLEAGVQIPLDTFGAYRQRFSKIEVKTR